jgi:uroporphyrinogen decarboxylase
MTERENALHALRGDGQTAWVPCVSKSVDILFPDVIEDKKREGTDWFGVRWREEVPVSHLTEDICSWRDVVKFRDLDAIDWEGNAKEILPKLDRKNRVIWAMLSVGLFERLHTILSFEDALASFYEEPEEVAALIAALADFRFRLTEKVLQYYDPDVINFRDDYGTQLSTFFSPDIFRRFFKPHIQRLADQAHSHGKLFVLHCCGKVDSLIGDFVELGVDAWDSVQPCCDLPAIFSKYGNQIGFVPVLDLQRFQFCSEEEARAIVRNAIDMLGPAGDC